MRGLVTWSQGLSRATRGGGESGAESAAARETAFRPDIGEQKIHDARRTRAAKSQSERRRNRSGGAYEALRETAHPERDARKAKKEAVTNAAESMHETRSIGLFFYKQWPLSFLPIS